MLSHELNVNQERQSLSEYVQVMCDDNSCDHINDVMRANQHHHDPLIAHDKKAQPREAQPALSPCL